MAARLACQFLERRIAQPDACTAITLHQRQFGFTQATAGEVHVGTAVGTAQLRWVTGRVFRYDVQAAVMAILRAITDACQAAGASRVQVTLVQRKVRMAESAGAGPLFPARPARGAPHDFGIVPLRLDHVNDIAAVAMKAGADRLGGGVVLSLAVVAHQQ